MALQSENMNDREGSATPNTDSTLDYSLYMQLINYLDVFELFFPQKYNQKQTLMGISIDKLSSAFFSSLTMISSHILHPQMWSQATGQAGKVTSQEPGPGSPSILCFCPPTGVQARENGGVSLKSFS